MDDHRNHIRSVMLKIVEQWSSGKPVTQDLLDQLPLTRVEMNVKLASEDGSQRLAGVVRIENGKVTFRHVVG
jgi:hypothetical protein